MAALLPLCTTAAVTEDTPAGVELNGRDYAVFVHDGGYYVTQNLCTHGPGLLSDGYIEGCDVECPIHQGTFNFITGAPSAPPCTEPLRTWTAHLLDGQICIDPDEQR